MIIKLLSNQESCFSIDQRHKAPSPPFSSNCIAFLVADATSVRCFGWPPDIFVAYPVVSVNIDQIMAGSLLRLKCIEKYNRLLEIEDDRGGTARFAGTTVSAGKANVSR
ncbi:MAG: hypothetical protein C0398_04460 [Coprothermobacter sp.]|nr:hypothetical protein [Coprothermobacter sp.]